MCVTPNPYARELGIATVGDTDRSGRFTVVETFWDSNGTLTVTVEDASETAPASHADYERHTLERARRLARRCLMHPEKTRSSRVLRSTTTDSGALRTAFAVSRLQPR